MKLSTKGRYGVKAIVDLAINYRGEPVSIKTISERQNISEYYLEQLFAVLRKGKIVKSIRGAQGGYILSRDPEHITIGEIIELLEGPVFLSECISEDSCENSDLCSTRLLWVRIKESIENVTRTTTLQDLIDDNNRLKSSSRKEK
ncbi:Rrf2 family transcriptional regulator [Clostridium sp. MSJ-11]|uniref:Rrf2 family transcriptional regulator n=1 Tax=Clostridium mobile TaxID=2841512 RepID=A0ABS6EIR2_9CLOT|nr:Rrf2 family transcriptional regulator [Clostridium mobile]MBU5484933.1 Rrf2 family transcriptional regulator [Clostridium mobile]